MYVKDSWSNETEDKFLNKYSPLIRFASIVRQHEKKNKKKHMAHITENDLDDSYIMQHHFSDLFVPDDEVDILDYVSGG